VPQQRPLLSQNPGRSRCGRPEPVTVCQHRPASPVQAGSPVTWAQQPEHLGVARRAVAPAVAVTLDPLRLVLRVGVRDEKPVRAGLVARDDISRAGHGQADQVGAAGRVAGGGQGVHDAERAV
jgi:hypothetical protein